MRVVCAEPDVAEDAPPEGYWQACRLAEQGRYDEARRLYAELVDSAAMGGESDARLRSVVRNDLAVLAAMEGRFDEARRGWQAALEIVRDCLPAHLNDALIAAELDRAHRGSDDIPGPPDHAPASVPFHSSLVEGESRMGGVALLPPDEGGHPERAGVRLFQSQPPPQSSPIESGEHPIPTKVAILSFLFNWPSTGGGNMHTAGLAGFLARAGYEVRHYFARFPAWGIGRVADELPGDHEALEFDGANWSVAEIQSRYRRAVDRFGPDYVIITDAWNMKPLLADAMRGYARLLLFQAQECLCPLNNLRLLGRGPGQVEQCPRNQLATPEICRRCVAVRGLQSGGLHRCERALAGVGTPEYDQALRRSLQEAEAVLALNPLTAAMLEPYASCVRIVPWGLDPARFPWPQPVEACESEGGPSASSRPVATLFMAAVAGEMIKGFHVAHEACRLLRQTRSDFELVVTFTPPGPGRIDEFTRSVGWCSQEELPRHYRSADICLVPTIAQDGLSITSVEAMASGIPVIASRIGGVPYTVSDGLTGLLFEPGDPADLARQIARLLDDPGLRRRMGLAGRKRFEEEFTWETVIERYWRPLLTSRADLGAAASSQLR
jgi:glycosyltransferase involved in cell wall biosynthesis